MTTTWPILPSFEKDLTKVIFTVNQISRGLTVGGGGGGGGITALTGDVVATGPGSVGSTIQADAVDNTKLANMPAFTFKGNNTGSTTSPLDLTAAQSIIALGVREPLTANRDYYVATAANGGSDSNDGRAPTVGAGSGPFLTVQKAITTAYGLIDLRGFDCTIHVGPGIFSSSGNNVLAPQVGAGTISIIGNGPSGGSATTISTTGTTFNVVRNAVLKIGALQLQSSGAYCLVAQQSGIIVGTGLGGATPTLAFDTAKFAHMYAASFGTITLTNTPYSIDTSTTFPPCHINANGNGYVSISGTPTNNTITILSALNFTQAFAVASNIGYIEASQITYTGAGYATTTGPRYIANYNSLIATAANMAMPGVALGSSASNFSNFY